LATDPVCGKDIPTSVVNQPVGQVQAGAPEIDPAAGTKRFHAGQWWYFCSVQCRQKFLAAPETYVERAERT
jgi:YHS domain-containing protein